MHLLRIFSFGVEAFSLSIYFHLLSSTFRIDQTLCFFFLFVQVYVSRIFSSFLAPVTFYPSRRPLVPFVYSTWTYVRILVSAHSSLSIFLSLSLYQSTIFSRFRQLRKYNLSHENPFFSRSESNYGRTQKKKKIEILCRKDFSISKCTAVFYERLFNINFCIREECIAAGVVTSYTAAEPFQYSS